MDIVTKDYQGKSRRNGGKLRLTTGNWIAIIIFLIGVLGTGYGFYYSTTALAKDVEASTIADKRQDNDIIEIKGDIEHLVKKTDTMDNRQIEMLELLYQIKGQLNQ